MIYDDYKSVIVREPTVLTIGNFDGVHLGHRELLLYVKKVAGETGLSSAVLTFTPHPRRYFGTGQGLLLITDDNEKACIFNRLKVDNVVFLTFNKGLSELSAYDFVALVLVKALNCKHVIVGEYHSFGKNKAGNTDVLRSLCGEFGISLDVIPPVYMEGERVSSARIRKALAQGNIKEANRLLSEPYFIKGEIVYGKSLGRTLGFPTINQSFSENKLLPKNGVYYTQTHIDGKVYKGITNVGVRPTVKGTGKTVETFLFDFDRTVYGETALVKFLHRGRDEMKFEGLEELKKAIGADKEAGLRFFMDEGLKND